MPEAPIHKNARPVLPQHQVGMSGQPPIIQSVSESPLPQPPPHNHLRLRVFRPNRRHIRVSLLWSEFIHITYISRLLQNYCPVFFSADCIRPISVCIPLPPPMMSRLFKRIISAPPPPHHRSTIIRPISFKAKNLYRCDSTGIAVIQ